MDRIEAMAVFVAAADEGSLSAAGRRLQMPLPSVSRKLADLEAHLGVRLMTRSTRQLTLTDAGRDYLVASREILDRVAEAERTAIGGNMSPRGELVIAAPLMFGRHHVLPIVMELLSQSDDVNVRLVLSDSNANLLEENIDVAVRIGSLPDSGLTARQVGEITRVVCASPAYLEKHGKPKTPSDLRNHACVTFAGLSSSHAWSFSCSKGTTRVPIRSRLTVNTADAAVAAATDGLGITRVLCYQAASQFAQNSLVRLLREYEPTPSPVNLLYARQGRLPAKTRCFLALAAERLTQALAGSE
ncbi:LysR family transcriptional regulator [Pseudomonas taiwanensis]|uniref:LysR family transcriptional regulator n=1 Tax=Pseudomonas taiwanensis TaxID=470150 RepID=UPI0015BE474D|nr:LysR family transcriptional regulator [Pseudomonas taiwanensis]NWL77265.1 LysR family transcriptional regulator [Pseudomonas taiwanensis]